MAKKTKDDWITVFPTTKGNKTVESQTCQVKDLSRTRLRQVFLREIPWVWAPDPEEDE